VKIFNTRGGNKIKKEREEPFGRGLRKKP